MCIDVFLFPNSSSMLETMSLRAPYVVCCSISIDYHFICIILNKMFFNALYYVMILLLCICWGICFLLFFLAVPSPMCWTIASQDSFIWDSGKRIFIILLSFLAKPFPLRFCFHSRKSIDLFECHCLYMNRCTYLCLSECIYEIKCRGWFQNTPLGFLSKKKRKKRILH